MENLDRRYFCPLLLENVYIVVKNTGSVVDFLSFLCIVGNNIVVFVSVQRVDNPVTYVHISLYIFQIWVSNADVKMIWSVCMTNAFLHFI